MTPMSVSISQYIYPGHNSFVRRLTGIFDSHSLFADMYAHPALYLNGTAPLNTTGAVQTCVFQLNESTSNPGDCTIITGTDKDSYLWFDELHPSEQADRVVAREIAQVIEGQENRWTDWLC